MLANVLAWIFLGVLAGFLVQYVFPGDRKNLRGIVLAGVIGAFAGGIVYSIFQIGSVAITLDPGAAFIALLGSFALIYLISAMLRSENLTGKRIRRD